MGAAMAARSARSRRWASSSASVNALTGGGAGAGADARGAAGGAAGATGGISGGVPALPGGALGSRSGTLSNHRSPLGGGRCEARGALGSLASRAPWARSATSPPTTTTMRAAPTT